MKAVKAIYEKGKIKLSEEPAEEGPLEVLVVFPEEAADPWEAILSEETPRPSFMKFVEECQEEIRQGKSEPLKLDELENLARAEFLEAVSPTTAGGPK